MLLGFGKSLFLAMGSDPFEVVLGVWSRALVGGYLLSPPELTRYAPILLRVSFSVVVPKVFAEARDELQPFVLHSFAANLEQLGRVDEPLVLENGLDHVATSAANRHGHGVVGARSEQVHFF